MLQSLPPTDTGLKDGQNHKARNRTIGGLLFAIVLVACFHSSLLTLASYAASSELFSYILLIPLVSGYLIYELSPGLPSEYRTAPILTSLSLLLASAALIAEAKLQSSGSVFSTNDSLSFEILAFVLFLFGGGFFFLGRKWMSQAAFPVGFLLFLVPIPDRVVAALEVASQVGSAEAANWFLEIFHTPVYRTGFIIELPGTVLRVAQECSGIRSSLALVITGILGSYLFLKSPWRRLILVAVLIPLGIFRNGFRIFVIAQLCVHIGPHMVDSVIHRRGGPIFFALALIPLFLTFWLLRRFESRSDKNTSQ